MSKKSEDAKDLKFYKTTIAVFIISAIIMGLFACLVIINNENPSEIPNRVVNILMDKEITSTEEIDGEYLTFSREVNKDYNPEKDEPMAAFKYFIVNKDGSKTELKDGLYYPASYYDKKKDVSPVAVNIGFYATILPKVNAVKNVLTVIVAMAAVLIFAYIIYAWYHSWCKRQDFIKEQSRKNNPNFKNKDNFEE